MRLSVISLMLVLTVACAANARSPEGQVLVTAMPDTSLSTALAAEFAVSDVRIRRDSTDIRTELADSLMLRLPERDREPRARAIARWLWSRLEDRPLGAAHVWIIAGTTPPGGFAARSGTIFWFSPEQLN